jgi:spore coat protein CotH
MKLLKDVWEWIKEWNDWGMKDWIKAGVVVAVVVIDFIRCV